MQMVLETRAGMEAGLVGSGHQYVASRLDAQRSTSGWVSEQVNAAPHESALAALPVAGPL